MKRVYIVVVLLLPLLSLIGCTNKESDEAQSALTGFFSHLSQGEFGRAAELYGGEYDVLSGWNTEIAPADHATLFEMGCLVNGLQCLPIKDIGAVENSAEGVYEFYVQFESQDGSLFVLNAADPAETGSTFKYTVFLSGDRFLVRELPPYLP